MPQQWEKNLVIEDTRLDKAMAGSPVRSWSGGWDCCGPLVVAAVSTAEDSLERILGVLLAKTDAQARQLGKIEASIERVATQHDQTLARVATLELKNAEHSGGVKMILLMSGFAATLGGIFASVISKVWWS